MTAYYNEIDPYAAQWLRNLIDAGHIAKGDVDARSIAEVTAGDVRGYRQCHFFAGIGGWSLALRLAGWPDDRFAWTGSCPCQSVSGAGQRKGHADKRHLWPAFHRLIAECSPSIVFGEQVASGDGREWLAGVRADLEVLGYACGAADLCAAGVAAPHPRQRLYWLADTGHQSSRWPAGAGEEKGWRPSSNASGSGAEPSRMGYAASAGLQGEWGEYRPRGERHSGFVGLAMQVGVPEWNGPTVAVQCSDGPRRVSAQPDSFPLAHGVSGRLGRLRAYGNAIVPQVAAQFISAACGDIRMNAHDPNLMEPLLQTAKGESPQAGMGRIFRDDQGAELFEPHRPEHRSSMATIGVLELIDGRWLARDRGFSIDGPIFPTRDQALRCSIARRIKQFRKFGRQTDGIHWDEGIVCRMVEWARSLKPRVDISAQPVGRENRHDEQRHGDREAQQPPTTSHDSNKTDPVIAELVAQHKARKIFPSGHTVAMTNPVVNGQQTTTGTCECGVIFRFPWGQYDKMDAAIELHWQKFHPFTLTPITQSDAVVADLPVSPEPACAIPSSPEPTAHAGSPIDDDGFEWSPMLRAAVALAWRDEPQSELITLHLADTRTILPTGNVLDPEFVGIRVSPKYFHFACREMAKAFKKLDALIEQKEAEQQKNPTPPLFDLAAVDAANTPPQEIAEAEA